jgi:hypothetical protein
LDYFLWALHPGGWLLAFNTVFLRCSILLGQVSFGQVDLAALYHSVSLCDFDRLMCIITVLKAVLFIYYCTCFYSKIDLAQPFNHFEKFIDLVASLSFWNWAFFIVGEL